MNRLEMAQKLFENLKLKARNDKGKIVFAEKRSNGEICIVWLESRFMVSLYFCLNETWEIIEPKLKEFSFGEIYHMMYYNNAKILITSISSGRMYGGLNTEFSIEELKGKWTIEGYYE